MARPRFLRIFVSLIILTVLLDAALAGESLRVATYNLENYLEAPSGNRPMKSEEAKAKIRESLRVLRADVIALQEMGGTNELFELRHSLQAEGLDYPHWDHINAHDTNIHLAILSKFPIVARRPHPNDSFLLFGKRFYVSRGFAEVDIQVRPNLSVTLLTAHLKSRLAVAEADEADLREQEALLLRQKVDDLLKVNPAANLIVLGDFNDAKNSPSIRTLIGRGRTALLDTRPAERNGDESSNSGRRSSHRNVTWTYYYSKEDTYSRIDYILASAVMMKRLNRNETYVLGLSNWGVASDHRPLMASFFVQEVK